MLVSCANTGNDDFERMIMLMVVVVVIIIMMKATFDEVFKAEWVAECEEEGASKEQEESEGPATPHVTAYLKISRRCHTTRSSTNEDSTDVQPFILNQQLI